VQHAQLAAIRSCLECLKACDRFGSKPRFADAGLTCDQQRLPRTSARLAQESMQQLKLRGTADKHRADNERFR
jgi:hypothetical protein